MSNNITKNPSRHLVTPTALTTDSVAMIFFPDTIIVARLL